MHGEKRTLVFDKGKVIKLVTRIHVPTTRKEIGGVVTYKVNGIYHREDGPAVERVDGSKEWWLNGEELTEEEHEQTQTRVFESATSDDFENSIFEGPTENIPF